MNTNPQFHMFSPYLLDLVIKDGEFKVQLDSYVSTLWFLISADGLQNAFSTPQSPLSENPSWDYPSRMIIQPPNIMQAYLYVTLCTYAPNGQDVIAIARSRVGLRSLPFSNPRQFKFPLMSAKNTAQEVMSLNVIATLSQLERKHESYGGERQRFQVVPPNRLNSF